MKKILFALALFLSIPTLFVFADDGPGPTSCINPGEGVSETCKVVSISNVVSLDASSQEDYLLGTHSRVQISRFNDNPYIPGQLTEYSKYSEQINSINKQTQDISGPDVTILSEPQDFSNFVILDKEYFLTRISEAFKKGGLSFSENNIPEGIRIYVLNSKELLLNHKDVEFYFKSHFGSSVPKMNSVIFNKDGYFTHTIFSIDDTNYGKHIYATKGGIIETEYIDVDKGGILTASDLQIGSVMTKHMDGLSVVPITSPLKSVKNYWIFTKKNGKLVLVWQKSEYGFDNGKVKVVTNADKNVSASLLFSDSSDTTPLVSSSTTMDFPTETQTEKKVGFFARLLNLISSWFK